MKAGRYCNATFEFDQYRRGRWETTDHGGMNFVTVQGEILVEVNRENLADFFLSGFHAVPVQPGECQAVSN